MADTQPGAVSASGKKSLPEGAILTRVSLKPSENDGFTVEQHYQAPERKAASGKLEYCGSSYLEPRDYTFESLDTLLAHLKALFSRGAKGGT